MSRVQLSIIWFGAPARAALWNSMSLYPGAVSQSETTGKGLGRRFDSVPHHHSVRASRSAFARSK